MWEFIVAIFTVIGWILYAALYFFLVLLPGWFAILVAMYSSNVAINDGSFFGNMSWLAMWSYTGILAVWIVGGFTKWAPDDEEGFPPAFQIWALFMQTDAREENMANGHNKSGRDQTTSESAREREPHKHGQDGKQTLLPPRKFDSASKAQSSVASAGDVMKTGRSYLANMMSSFGKRRMAESAAATEQSLGNYFDAKSDRLKSQMGLEKTEIEFESFDRDAVRSRMNKREELEDLELDEQLDELKHRRARNAQEREAELKKPEPMQRTRRRPTPQERAEKDASKIAEHGTTSVRGVAAKNALKKLFEQYGDNEENWSAEIRENARQLRRWSLMDD